MTNSDFWARLILTCFWCMGVWTLFDKGMLLGRLGDYLAAKWPEWARKPTFDCPACMASFHGTIFWFGLGGDLWRWPIFCIVLCGANRVMSYFLKD
jgi:hypothetical protein